MIEPKPFAVRDLACVRGGRVLFEGLSLTLEPGRAMLVAGPNGVGKSSLLRILAGLLRPSEGGLSRDGAALQAGGAEHARLVCYLGAWDPIKPMLTVAEHAAFDQALSGHAVDGDAADAVLDRLGLFDEAETPGRHLSTGQRRRLSLVHLLLRDAALWILDEPGNGLDVEGRAVLAELMAEHLKRGGMIIAATHQELGLVEPERLVLGEPGLPILTPSPLNQKPSPSTGEGWVGVIHQPPSRTPDEPESSPAPPPPNPPPSRGRAYIVGTMVSTDGTSAINATPSRSAFTAILRRDLSLGLRQASDAMGVLVFFLIAATLFPLGVGPEPGVLARIAPGVLWVTALLAAMLSFDRLFAVDYEDGSLDRLLLSPTPLAWAATAKILAHWLTTGFPLMLIAPVLAVMLRLPTEGIPVLLAGMGLGTPALSLLGGLGAALTLGARRGAVLIPLLILPLSLPILIFGVGAVEAAMTGLGARPHLLILAAYLALALPTVPLATAAALRAAQR